MTPRRRLLLSALACWPASRLLAQPEDARRPQRKISAAQLHEALSARFPLRLGVPGMLDLRVSAPQLLLLPTRNRVGATLVAELGGPQMQQLPAGELDVVFALRYEAGDQTVRGHSVQVLGVRWPGLAPQFGGVLESLLPQLARDAVGEILLHRLTARELALADTMGFEPERFTVVEDGVVIVFGPKVRR
jgi:hypothetical protein